MPDPGGLCPSACMPLSTVLLIPVLEMQLSIRCILLILMLVGDRCVIPE